MILIIRGHIRNSFINKDFLNLVKSIYKIDNNLKIYIHTWNIFSSNKSWRYIETNNTQVTKEIIYEYFQELRYLIKKIIIDNDTNISLIGNLEGQIKNCLMPIISWKNYWYGKYRIINYINKLDIDKNEITINCRFDVLNNSYSFNHNEIINFCKYTNNKNIIFTKNIFINDFVCKGIDNIYIGNINTMYKLIYEFNFNLDEIINNNQINHPEFLVFITNNNIFSI
jgi:hypothetical protein